MLISIITEVLNAKDTIEEAIQSVLNQTYKNIEYVIIDGKSTDGTLKIINKYRDRISKFISEPDSGHFEAMNKGLKLAKGEVVGFLHADDFFATDKVIKNIAKIFEERDVHCLWGNLVYVSRKNTEKIIRYWKSCSYRENLFEKGWMPPHPTFFAKRQLYEKYGYFNTDLEISADYEIMLRFLHKHRLSTYHFPEVLVKMRVGGISNRSLKNIIEKSMQDYKTWKINGLEAKISTIMMKNILKIPQFFIK
ncbi:MAG: glycosyltransferase [Candidatus Omnitrophica bacterium]|nr:glycosyltransferase [Candidatus Omnitrophota bacterium]